MENINEETMNRSESWMDLKYMDKFGNIHIIKADEEGVAPFDEFDKMMSDPGNCLIFE